MLLLPLDAVAEDVAALEEDDDDDADDDVGVTELLREVAVDDGVE